jgi:hypothetical protein
LLLCVCSVVCSAVAYFLLCVCSVVCSAGTSMGLYASSVLICYVHGLWSL